MTKYRLGLTMLLAMAVSPALACQYSNFIGKSYNNTGALIGSDWTADFQGNAFTVHDETPPFANEGGTVTVVTCDKAAISFQLTDLHPNPNNADCHLRVDANSAATGACTGQTGGVINITGHVQQ